MTAESLSYNVPGVTCEHCRTAIGEEVGMVSGVESVKVDLELKLVTVKGQGASDSAVRTAIGEAGYEVFEPPTVTA